MTGGPVKMAVGGMSLPSKVASSLNKTLNPRTPAIIGPSANKANAIANSDKLQQGAAAKAAQAASTAPAQTPTNIGRLDMRHAKGGVIKKGNGGGVFNEKGKRATWDEAAAEGRRMEGRKPPVEGISTRPTDSSGRRMTNKELGMTPGGVDTAKKTMKKAIGGGVFPEGGKRAPKPMPTNKYVPGTAERSGGLTSAYVDAMQKREDAAYQARMVADAKSKKATGVRPSSAGGSLNPTAPTRGPSTAPAFNDRPMVRRSKGGLTAMPKGKC